MGVLTQLYMIIIVSSRVLGWHPFRSGNLKEQIILDSIILIDLYMKAY